MLYNGAVEYAANTWICVYINCEMSGQLRASESFFSYFRVEIVGPIFLSFFFFFFFFFFFCFFLEKTKKKTKKKKKTSSPRATTAHLRVQEIQSLD